MKVYLAISDYGYDGGDILLGVYSSKYKAEQRCAIEPKSWYHVERVEEVTIDEDI